MKFLPDYFTVKRCMMSVTLIDFQRKGPAKERASPVGHVPSYAKWQ
jgi:hypothetical protein